MLILESKLDFEEVSPVHVGIAHTRWATHGAPSIVNSHPQRSDDDHQFVVVHNGIVTNYKDVKTFLIQKGYKFESETDTEVIAKLVHHIYLQNEKISFRELVEQVIQQLVSDTPWFSGIIKKFLCKIIFNSHLTLRIVIWLYLKFLKFTYIHHFKKFYELTTSNFYFRI